jgi:hypothetical protein
MKNHQLAFTVSLMLNSWSRLEPDVICKLSADLGRKVSRTTGNRHGCLGCLK